MELPIATRSFYLKGRPRREPAVVFRIWPPYETENNYPRCAYELISPEGTQKGEVSGIDALDCIIMCLSQAGTKIAGLNESVFGGQLEWEGSPEGGRGLGLPTAEDHWPLRESYQEALKWARDQQPPQR